MNFPEHLYYTEDHEWVSVDGNVATVGITEFAQKELGEIVYIEVETVDEEIDKGDVFGTVEAVKTVSDLFMPLSGKVTEFNEDLEDSPESVNEDPYNKGWMIKIEMNDPAQVEDLLKADAYKESTGV